MTHFPARLMPALTLLLTHVSCSIPEASEATILNKSSSDEPPIKDRHVIFIGIDGLGSHNLWPEDSTIAAPNVPNLDFLKQIGTYSKHAAIDRRNWSGPNWAGMLTGQDSDTTGIHSNACKKSAVPTVFDIIDQNKHELEAGMVVGWKKLSCFNQGNSPDFVHHVDGTTSEIAHKAIRLLSDHMPNFLFIYFGNTDSVGHKFGAKSPEYKTAIEEVDTAIGSLVSTLKERNQFDSTSIIISSDHGHAIDKLGHSSSEFPVPFIVRSPHLRPGTIEQNINNRDTTPLILWLLGLKEEKPF